MSATHPADQFAYRGQLAILNEHLSMVLGGVKGLIHRFIADRGEVYPESCDAMRIADLGQIVALIERAPDATTIRAELTGLMAIAAEFAVDLDRRNAR